MSRATSWRRSAKSTAPYLTACSSAYRSRSTSRSWASSTGRDSHARFTAARVAQAGPTALRKLERAALSPGWFQEAWRAVSMASANLNIPAEQPTSRGWVGGAQTWRQIWTVQIAVNAAITLEKSAIPPVLPSLRRRSRRAEAGCTRE